MKKYFLMLGAALLSIALVSCKKDDNGNTLKEDENGSTSDYPSLNGSAYIPIILDAASTEFLGTKIIASLAVNESTTHNWWWSGLATLEPVGLSFYGLTDGWFSVKSAPTEGWSGGAYNVADNHEGIGKMAQIGSDWYLHLAFKGQGEPIGFIINWGGKKFAFTVGNGNFVDNGETYTNYKPVSGAFVADEWNEYEFAVKDMGLDFSAPCSAGGENILVYLLGGDADVECNCDAVFFYKK